MGGRVSADLLYFFVPTYSFISSGIASDDKSYVSHAFTLGLDFDTDYSNEIAVVFNKDKNIPSHPIGTGILAAPFGPTSAKRTPFSTLKDRLEKSSNAPKDFVREETVMRDMVRGY